MGSGPNFTAAAADQAPHDMAAGDHVELITSN